MEKLYNINDVVEITTLSKSTILRLVYERTFPQPFKISGRRKAWHQKDVDEWVRNQGNGYSEDAFANGEHNT